MGDEHFETAHTENPKPKKSKKDYLRRLRQERETKIASKLKYELRKKGGAINVLFDPFSTWYPSRGDHISHNGTTYEVTIHLFDTKSEIVTVQAEEIEP